MTIDVHIGGVYLNRTGDEITIDRAAGEEGGPQIFRGSDGLWYLPSGRINDDVSTHNDFVQEITYFELEGGYYWARLGPEKPWIMGVVTPIGERTTSNLIDIGGRVTLKITNHPDNARPSMTIGIEHISMRILNPDEMMESLQKQTGASNLYMNKIYTGLDVPSILTLSDHYD